jgi:diacylglycerol kinase (ATP)
MSRPYTLILNPAAGRGRARALLPRLEAALERSGLDAELAVSAGPGDAVRLGRAAAARGRALVACGGDGLVGALAAIAAEAGIEFAVVPLGGGNDFARHLGLDVKRPLAALRVLGDGAVAELDLGRVNGRPFCCIAGAGFDAEANRWANSATRLRGTPRYVAAVLRTLARYRPQPFRITADGATREFEAWLIAVANGPSYGGGMLVAPAARSDDGELQVVVIGAISRLDFLRTFPKVFDGSHVRHPAVEVFAARRVELAAPGAALPLEIYADGERVGPLPAEIEVMPRALRALVPQGAALLSP